MTLKQAHIRSSPIL